MGKKELMNGIESILTGEELAGNSLSGNSKEKRKKTSSVKADKKETKSSSSASKTSDDIDDNLKIAIDPSSPESSNTHIVPDKLMGKARHIANKVGVSVKDIMNQSLTRFITRWEQKNYRIKIACYCQEVKENNHLAWQKSLF